MRKLFIRLLAVAMAVGMSFWIVLPAGAQDQKEDKDESVFTLEEVTVTATKRSESLQAVPRSLSVISADDLQVRVASSSVQEIIENTAGVSFAAGGPWLNHIGMRGVMPNTAEFGSEPAVQFNIDGNVSMNSENGIPSMFKAMNDVERIEVLRGPSGAINGRMAAAGSVNVVSKDPDFDDFNGYVGYNYGNYETKNAKAAINLPLSATGLDLPSYIENLALRFAYRQDEHDYYVKFSDEWVDLMGEDASGNQDFMTWRAKLKWQPAPFLDVLAHLEYSVDESNTSLTVTPIDKAGIFPFPTPPHSDDPWLLTFPLPSFPASKKEEWTNSLKVNWTTGYGTVTGRYAHTRIPVDCSQQAGGPGPGQGGVCYDGDKTQDEYEVYIASLDSSKIEWMAGAYYYYKKDYTGPDQEVASIDPDAVTISFTDYYGNADYYPGVSFPTFDANNLAQPWMPSFVDVNADSIVFLANTANRPIDSYSIYGSIKVPFLEDRHAFTLSLRKNWEEKKRQVAVAVYGADEFNTNNGLPHFTWDAGSSQWECDNCYELYQEPSGTWVTNDNPVNYTVGYEFNLNDDILLYANVNNGYKPGGISPNAMPPTFYEPEKMTNYALGTRSKWFDSRFRLNVEAYLMTFENYQQNLASEGVLSYPLGGTTYTQAYRFQSRTENYGTTNIWGIELDYDWLITNRDRLKGNAEFRHAEYGDFDLDRGSDTQNPPGSPRYVHFGGRQMAFSPKFSWYGSYSHRFNIGDITITPQVDARYVSKSFVNSEYWWEVVQPEIWQPAYWKFDGFLSIAPESGRWVVNAYIKNATETVIRNFAGFVVNIEAPRTYGVGLTFNF